MGIYGTPTMFVDMLAQVRARGSDMSSAKTGLMAGAPCPQELCKNVMSEMNMKDFVVCYGMTETSPVTFQGFASDSLAVRTGTIGFPANHVEVAVMDPDGQIVGRMKDMIIRGGENIYPREIEEFLHTHPAIMEAQAFGVRDARMGEELCAWVKLNPGHSLQEEEIRRFCKGNISHFKIPKYFSFVTEFPTTVTGKIQKFVMREVMEDRIK